jgi:hypothetical protein
MKMPHNVLAHGLRIALVVVAYIGTALWTLAYFERRHLGLEPKNSVVFVVVAGAIPLALGLAAAALTSSRLFGLFDAFATVAVMDILALVVFRPEWSRLKNNAVYALLFNVTAFVCLTIGAKAAERLFVRRKA